METNYETVADLIADRKRMANALFDLVDAICGGTKRPWDLEGYGITSKRAEEICELAERGRSY